MTPYLALQMTPEAWTFAGATVAVLGGIATTIILQVSQIKTIKLNAQIAAKEREIIKTGIADNTALTKVTANNIDTMAGKRMAIALGRKHSIEHKPEFIEISLPGVDYEPFGLSTGDLVEWRSEPCERGRQVRFKVHGPASIGFHFHLLVEITFGIAGTLTYETMEKMVRIGPGDRFTAEADEIHKASFDGPGEAVCHWPDQIGPTLIIGFYP